MQQSEPIRYIAGTKLERGARSHTNFTEYKTIFLIALVALEYFMKSKTIIHALGSIFLFGRVLHFFSLNYYEIYFNNYIFRQIGMGIIFFSLISISYIEIWRNCFYRITD